MRVQRALILALIVAGCKQDAPQAAPPSVQHMPPNSTAVVLPTMKQDSLSIEGQKSVTNLRLLTSNSSVRFLTYYPSDVAHEERKTGDCDGHYFFADMNGVRNEQAYLLMCVMNNGLTQDQAVAIAKKLKAELDQPGMFVDIELKQHNVRYYMIVKHWPGDYGDGFGPRAQKILDQWQWLDAS